MSMPTMIVRYLMALTFLVLAVWEAGYLNVVVDASVRAPSTGTSFIVLMLGILIWDRSELFKEKLLSVSKARARLSILAFAVCGVAISLFQCDLCSFEQGNNAYGRVFVGTGLFSMALISLSEQRIVGCLNRWRTRHLFRKRTRHL